MVCTAPRTLRDCAPSALLGVSVQPLNFTVRPQTSEMTKTPLRTAAIFCLAIWVAIWLMFLFMRLSPLDIRGIPAVGVFVLVALAVALLAPIMATGLAAVALVRQPRVPVNWLTFGCAVAALLGQVFLFLSSRWL